MKRQNNVQSNSNSNNNRAKNNNNIRGKNNNDVRSNNNNNVSDSVTDTNKKNNSDAKNVGFDVKSTDSFELDEDNDHSFELTD